MWVSHIHYRHYRHYSPGLELCSGWGSDYLQLHCQWHQHQHQHQPNGCTQAPIERWRARTWVTDGPTVAHLGSMDVWSNKICWVIKGLSSAGHLYWVHIHPGCLQLWVHSALNAIDPVYTLHDIDYTPSIHSTCQRLHTQYTLYMPAAVSLFFSTHYVCMTPPLGLTCHHRCVRGVRTFSLHAVSSDAIGLSACPPWILSLTVHLDNRGCLTHICCNAFITGSLVL